jgi:lysophospholipase L1-like esterase
MIRTGYQPDVSNYLVNKAEIWGPEIDVINTVSILQNLKDWIQSAHYDIIHINSGLNDLRILDYNGNDNLIPLEFYSKNVERIIKSINRYSPQSVIVWATTTPVVNEIFNVFHQNQQDYQLKNEDVIRYNDSSLQIASRLGVAINDLYSYIMTGDPGLIIQEDGVNYTEYGNELLAERITAVLEKIIDNQ